MATSSVKENVVNEETAFAAAFRSRVTVLVSLMIVQSLSGIILASFEDLIQSNVAITLFLTMLVGAGGNAGNQSTVHVIRGLATGKFGNIGNRGDRSQKKHAESSDAGHERGVQPHEAARNVHEVRILAQEAKLGLSLGFVLATVAFARVWLWRGDLAAAVAIGLSALAIVAVSAVVGAALPLLFVRIGIDPAHAGPSIQVAMDIIGVTVTCVICTSVFAYFQVSSEMENDV